MAVVQVSTFGKHYNIAAANMHHERNIIRLEIVINSTRRIVAKASKLSYISNEKYAVKAWIYNIYYYNKAPLTFIVAE